ncbi:MAG TPA: S-methyl-5-thioribose-1-phosphate isomerase [Sphingobacteriaceae bacterium]|nr:S-methyl-5-thioribose-1-phosphate isomerase [Sphingobacteriaceae bacterium]
MIQPLRWHGRRLDILDQRLLPGEEVWIPCTDEEAVAEAIRGMAVRGAPAIGVAAAYGLALAAGLAAEEAGGDAGRRAARVLDRLDRAARLLAGTRPTAVNLFWALDRVKAKAQETAAALQGEGGGSGGGSTDGQDPARAIAQAVAAEAAAIEAEDRAANREIGRWGSRLLRGVKGIYTHCNTGALATAGYGTALGVIRALHEENPDLHVYAGETRPYLQGSRLTAWELKQENIPFSLCVDAAAGHLMAQGAVEAVVTGADRITANGDVVNKIGTYGLAVLARHHRIPFYVAAPLSTVDMSLADGRSVTIEERPAAEVTHVASVPVAPEGTNVVNPAFDITPASLVTAFITEVGIARPPYEDALRRLTQLEEEGAQRA